MEKSNIILAKCGLLCNECPAYQATINDDNDLRKKTVKEWNEHFKLGLSWQDINCLGCQQDEVLSGYCSQCQIRLCANEKKLVHCGFCKEKDCEKVQAIWIHEKSAKKRLENDSENAKIS